MPIRSIQASSSYLNFFSCLDTVYPWHIFFIRQSLKVECHAETRSTAWRVEFLCNWHKSMIWNDLLLQLDTYSRRRFLLMTFPKLIMVRKRNHTKTDTYLISNLHFSQVMDYLLSLNTMNTYRDHINQQYLLVTFFFRRNNFELMI